MAPRLAALLCLAVLIAATPSLWADEGSGTAPAAGTEAAVATEAAPPAEVTPLMAGLDYFGVGNPMRQLNLRASGYMEGGYTYSFKHGSGGVGGNTLLNTRYFDLERGNHFQLDNNFAGFPHDRDQVTLGCDVYFTF